MGLFGLGCVDEGVDHHGFPIINGSPANGGIYDAVISIHENSRRGVSISPFCSGTLIGDDVVLTAAHCLAGKTAAKVAVYFGASSIDEYYAGTLTASDFHMVSEVRVHPSYNSSLITNDIALMRLSSPVSSSVAVPVPALPASQGFTTADEGRLALDFAGFGVDEDGAFGDKLHVVGVLDHLQGTHQIYYYQPTSAGGPCSGDSGGPAFVARGGTNYVGGITSYGDANCTVYGVSTRADAFQTFIDDFMGVTPPPDCSADGYCNPDCTSDPDCGSSGVCGDAICDGGETCSSCPADCQISHPKKGVLACCGDGICSSRETTLQCPADCL
jgi:secreted trypsin-like serine protease